MFAALSENAEFFRERMNLFVAIAPTVFVSNMKDEAILAINKNEKLIKSFKLLGLDIFSTEFGTGTVNEENISEIGLQNFFKFFPAGTSHQCLYHWKQLLDTGEFKKFDYGEKENLKRYGHATPPSYNLKNIKGFNINLVCGTEDELVTPEDYNAIRRRLEENGNDVDFQEYKLGHVGLLMPKDLKHTG